MRRLATILLALVGVPLWRFVPDHIPQLHRLVPDRVAYRGRIRMPGVR